MKRQPRLGRSEVIARLRDHAARYGAVSSSSLHKHDRLVQRSLHLYFPNFEAARRAARVPAARPAATARGKRRSSKAVWSRRRVLDELRLLDRSGQSTAWADLMQAGRGDLVAAAATYAGGLTQARAQAGVQRPARRRPVPRWNKSRIVLAIQDRLRKGQTLASSKAPARFVAAARWHFGSWTAALAAAGVDAQAVRLQRRPYEKPEVLALLRRLAREGKPLRASTLKGVINLETIRKLFGSVEAAVHAAGVTYARKHPNQKWSRARLIKELRARAKRGELTLTRALSSAVQLYFGGAHAARVAAGIPTLLRTPWTKESLIKELRRRARQGDGGRTLWNACKRLFGSVAAARRAAGVAAPRRTKGMVAWDKPALLAELRRRVRKGQQLSRGITAGLRQQFGSLARARVLAGVPARGDVAARAASSGVRRAIAARRSRWRRWSREQVLEKLRTWNAGGGRLRNDVFLACKQHFGSVARACEAAGLPGPASLWTPARIRRALREPGFDVLDPAFVAACIDHFGSVTAARASAARHQRQRMWTKATVLAELQARARRGIPGVGRLLRDPAVRLFGSTEAALRAAAQRDARASR
jgi:hypothetical protein